jgi:hypothetical protein
MGVPLATTTVTVTRPKSGGDPYEDATVSEVARGVRANIVTPSGIERTGGGAQERIDAVLLCDPVAGLDHYCIVTDDRSAEAWQVAWVRTRRGLGMDHVRAGLNVVTGGSHG